MPRYSFGNPYSDMADRLLSDPRAEGALVAQEDRSPVPSKKKKTRRKICPGCEGSLTSTDFEAGKCTQCGFKLPKR